MNRSRHLGVVMLAILLICSAPVASAWADSGSGTTNAPSTAVDTKPSTDTKVPDDTSTKPPTDTETTTPETPSNPDVNVPDEPKVPSNPGCVGSACVPDNQPGPKVTTQGGGAQLPFTGPGDVVLAILLAMLAGAGGLLFLVGATGREQIDGLSKRTMSSPSGWHIAYRDLRKNQLRDE